MPTRRLWVLLLLAAVFSMHGAQYVAADANPRHTAAVIAPYGADETLGAGALLGSMIADDELQHANSAVGTMAAAGQPAPDHGVAAHVWALCLAVLFAGLILLAAATLVGRVAGVFVSGARSQVRSSAGWFRVPRPPDLSALCLLRI